MYLRKYLLLAFFYLFSFSLSFDVVYAIGEDWKEEKTIYHYDGRTSNTGAPTYITFSSQYRTKEGKLFVFVINATT